MNARVIPLRPAPALLPHEPGLGEALSGMWEDHTERIVLGAAMLGEPMPAWLEPRHFFPTQHQRIYGAVQDVGGHVARVNEWLRASSKPTHPQIASSSTLAAMCFEADWVLRQGWEVDCEGVRELWRRRELLQVCSRLVITLRSGQVDHGGAYQALKAHFKAVR